MRAEFRHEALIYNDAQEFLDGTVPFLRAGLEAGAPTMVAVSQVPRALLEEELGIDALEISFVDMEELGRNPARIIPLWHQFVEESAGRPARGIGEPVWPGRRRHEIDECQRHESLLNVAFDGEPAWTLLCPYDGSALDDEVLRRVGDSHRHVTGSGASGEVSGYLDQVDCFAGEFPGRPPVMDAFDFARDGLPQVRRRVEQAASLVGMAADRAADLVLAASELAANSVNHGGGTGTVRVWRDGDRLVVEVEDSGLIEEPLAGRIRPEQTQLSGRGLWLANQLCDLVQIRSGLHGTAVRLHSALA
ncbi:MAG TPA: sensor histidine kinase [Solirubrobacterales bacterium]|nr:sensor histidine kinase [Solirubrobacterales bacterium]